MNEGEARRIVAGLLTEIARTARDDFPGLALPAAVVMAIIVGEIIAAEIAGRRISEARLARAVEMPRKTLARRVGYLVRVGLVTRERDGLAVVRARLKPATIRRTAALVIEAADALRGKGK